MMDIFTTIVLAIGLAMDVFAVSLGIGTSPIEKTPRRLFRLSFHFGLFQAAMTLLGWQAGNSVTSLISGYDHWIVLILLGWIGVRMIISGLSPDSPSACVDLSKGVALISVCVATSIDALAAGISLAMMDVNLLLACLIIGFTSILLSIIGLLVGNVLGKRFGNHMEILGGIILIAIGLRVALRHLELIR